ncbi:hypothetical protein bpr_I1127 [Butyrivibrio proteoclasticus B316]|uniref:Uncharacterized protein n=1 Tax=Butyrivibrio proteoclasticus (strain ATCC 51982 / DSM 14932 / B316) TaxID=515622 RepID=E0S242_BUTPB|nr:hypothetical protein bpr_I1127 [Butyrivibrio proteoclasticus B316]
MFLIVWPDNGENLHDLWQLYGCSHLCGKAEIEAAIEYKNYN